MGLGCGVEGAQLEGAFSNSVSHNVHKRVLKPRRDGRKSHSQGKTPSGSCTQTSRLRARAVPLPGRGSLSSSYRLSRSVRSQASRAIFGTTPAELTPLCTRAALSTLSAQVPALPTHCDVKAPSQQHIDTFLGQPRVHSSVCQCPCASRHLHSYEILQLHSLHPQRSLFPD